MNANRFKVKIPRCSFSKCVVCNYSLGPRLSSYYQNFNRGNTSRKFSQLLVDLARHNELGHIDDDLLTRTLYFAFEEAIGRSMTQDHSYAVMCFYNEIVAKIGRKYGDKVFRMYFPLKKVNLKVLLCSDDLGTKMTFSGMPYLRRRNHELNYQRTYHLMREAGFVCDVSNLIAHYVIGGPFCEDELTPYLRRVPILGPFFSDHYKGYVSIPQQLMLGCGAKIHFNCMSGMYTCKSVLWQPNCLLWPDARHFFQNVREVVYAASLLWQNTNVQSLTVAGATFVVVPNAGTSIIAEGSVEIRVRNGEMREERVMGITYEKCAAILILLNKVLASEEVDDASIYLLRKFITPAGSFKYSDPEKESEHVWQETHYHGVPISEYFADDRWETSDNPNEMNDVD